MLLKSRQEILGARYGFEDWHDRKAHSESTRKILSLLNVALGQAVGEGRWLGNGHSGNVEQPGTHGTEATVKRMSLLGESYKPARHENLDDHGDMLLDTSASGSLTQFEVFDKEENRLVAVDLDPSKSHREAIVGVSVFGDVAGFLGRKNSPSLFPGCEAIVVSARQQEKLKSRVVVRKDTHHNLKGFGENVVPLVGAIEYEIDHNQDGTGRVNEVMVKVDQWQGKTSERMGDALLIVAKRGSDGKFELYRRDYKDDKDGILETRIPGHVAPDNLFEDVLIEPDMLTDNDGNTINMSVVDNPTGHVSLEFKFMEGTQPFGKTYSAALHPINVLDVIDKGREYVEPET